MNLKPIIKMFTDGSSRGNPGPGGYGVILSCPPHYKELSEGFKLTTNNRMELLAVIAGLEAIKNPLSKIDIYSDSRYVVDAIEKKWIFAWQKKDFKGKKNADLWKRFLEIYNPHRMKFKWLKGHAGHIENERCDSLAVKAAQNAVKDDFGYIKDINSDFGGEKGGLFSRVSV